MRRQGEIDGQAVIAYICTVDVADVDAATNTAVANGGQIALPKMPVPRSGMVGLLQKTPKVTSSG